jgi:hypothetical protein
MSGCAESDLFCPYAAPGKYDFLDCPSIADRLKATTSREQQLIELMSRAKEATGGSIVNAMAYQDDLNTVKASKIGVLVNPRNPPERTILAEMQTAAGALGVEMYVMNAATEAELDAAFTTLVQQEARALVVAADPFFNGQRETLVALAARRALPAIYEWREFVAAGGLVSY